nr:hypothetical protein Q903MT_gene3372 [Picea sitchensis]
MKGTSKEGRINEEKPNPKRNNLYYYYIIGRGRQELTRQKPYPYDSSFSHYYKYARNPRLHYIFCRS